MSKEKQLLLLALAALFHHARLTRLGSDPAPALSFQEAHDFMEAAQQRLDMENLLK